MRKLTNFFDLSKLSVLLVIALLFTSCSAVQTRKDEEQPDHTMPDPTGLSVAASELLADYAFQIKQMNLHLPQTLSITRPDEYLNTEASQYYIMGTSDPSQPLYINDEEVMTRGPNGSFGLLIELEMAENYITAVQDDIKREVIISREEVENDALPTINYIPQDSMYPLVQGGTRVGKTLPVSCTAPAGSLVMATFGKETITLEQSTTADKNTPVLFTGSLPVSGDFTPDETVKVGPVTYALTLNGKTTRYESTGDIYIAGEETNIAVRVSNYIGFLYPSLDDLSVFTEIIKEGGVDYLMSQGNKYFSVYSGGYIPAAMVEIVEGKDPVANTISEISASTKNKGELYEFSGTSSPFYDVRVNEDTVEFEMKNTSIDDISFPSLPENSIFSAVEIIPEERSVIFEYTLKKAGEFWGYNVTFDQNDIFLEIQHKPSLSENELLPLKGITIALDPGHGGEDPGTISYAGGDYASEADINLAHAFLLKNKLTSLGAEVKLTRDIDAYYTIDERLEMHERFQADMFISLHHNSVVETMDAREAFGMEAYYYTSFSYPLAEAVMNGLNSATSRSLRGVNHSYYRITLLPYSPSILVELAFVSNMNEFEESLQFETMQKVAQGITNGILEVLE